MLKNRLLSALSLTFVLTLLSACGENGNRETAGSTDDGTPLVIVGTNPDYPPMQFIDTTTGEMVGYEIDLMHAIAEAGGFRIQWKNIEWRGIFSALESRDIDAIISAATITEERARKYDFSNPYHTISQRLVIRSADADKITAIEDLADKRIGVQLGTTGFLLVQEQFPRWQTATYDNAPMAFADLEAGGIFGFMVDEPVADAYSRAKPETADKFHALPFQFSEEHYGIVIRKNQPELLRMINQGLASVKEAGIDLDLKEKWIK